MKPNDIIAYRDSRSSESHRSVNVDFTYRVSSINFTLTSDNCVRPLYIMAL